MLLDPAYIFGQGYTVVTQQNHVDSAFSAWVLIKGGPHAFIHNLLLTLISLPALLSLYNLPCLI